MDQVTHARRPGAADTDGQFYEIKMAALLFLRANHEGLHFRLASNVDGAGAFDDIVFQFQRGDVTNTLFIQLKHKQSAKLRRGMLLGPKGEFSLLKYLSSFVEVCDSMSGNTDFPFKGPLHAAHFLIFTNSEMHRDLVNTDRVVLPSVPDTFVSTQFPRESVFSLTEAVDGEIYEYLIDKVQSSEEDEKKARIPTASDVKTFLSRLRFYTGEPSDQSLDDILIKQLQSYCEILGIVYNARMYDDYIREFKSWWEKKGEAVILSESSDILRRVIDQVRVELSSNEQKKELSCEVKFKASSTARLKEALSGPGSIVVIADVSVKLTTARMMQVLSPDSYIFTGSRSLLKDRSTLMDVWKHGRKHLLVVVDESGHKQEELSGDLSRVLKDPVKRVVLVTPSLSSQPREYICQSFQDQFLPSDLDPDCVRELLKREVSLQGYPTSLGSILDSEELPEVFSCCLEHVIENKQLGVGDKLQDLVTYYVERAVLHEHSSRVVLLVAEPGMGKSTYLARLAHKIKSSQPNVWVLNITLSDWTLYFRKTEVKCISAEDFLFKALGFHQKSSFERVLLEYFIRTPGKMILLVDGFDEIAPTYTEKCLTLLTKLLETNVDKMWVSSRHSMREELENSLSTKAVTLQRFTAADQRGFLLNYWTDRTGRSKRKLVACSEKVMKMAAQSTNDRDLNFTGIPLQTIMLADVFLEYATGKEPDLPEKISMIQLIEKFVEKKLYTYVSKRFKISEEHTDFDDIMSRERSIFDANHEVAALYLLFEEEDLNGLNSFDEKKARVFICDILSGKDKTGLIDRVAGGKPFFLHRVFAEYYAALWLTKNYAVTTDLMRGRFLQQVFGNVVAMFNRMLAGDRPLHIAVLNGDLNTVVALLKSDKTLVNLKDDGDRTALHLAAMSVLSCTSSDDTNCIPTIELLLKNGARTDIEDKVLKKTPLLCTEPYLLLHGAAKRDCPVLAETLITWARNQSQSTADGASRHGGLIELLNAKGFLGCNALMIACQSGSLSVFHVIINALRNLVDSSEDDCRLMTDHLLETDTWDRHALFHCSSGGHISMMRLLIDLGACVTKRDNFGITVLMVATWSHVEAAVQLILDNIADDEKRDYVNLVETRGCDAFWYACSNGHYSVLRLLVDAGADITTKDKRDMTALMSLSSGGHFVSVKFILDALPADKRRDHVMQLDHRGYDALLWASCAGHSSVMRLLVDAGADITRIYEGNMTALMAASGWGHVSAVQFILSCVSEDDRRLRHVNERDVGGRTALCNAKYSMLDPFERFNKSDLQAVERILLEAGGVV